MKIEASPLHSERFAELADFYRQAMDLAEPTPLGDSHLGRPSTTPYLGFDDDPYGAISIWFKVHDVDAAIDKLVALGATPLTPAEPRRESRRGDCARARPSRERRRPARRRLTSI